MDTTIMESTEKRRFARHDISRHGWATFATGPRFEVTFKNISATGALVLLTTSRHFEIDDKLALTMTRSGTGILSTKYSLSRQSAKVVRIEPQSSNRKVELAVRFNGPVNKV